MSSTDLDLQAAVGSTFLAFAGQLDTLPEPRWDTPSLCEGWRVREVVAHLTMPARYTTEEFQRELEACGWDFTRLSNQIADRDGALATTTLVANLCDPGLHGWTPPGGGWPGALNHVVIHSLDVTVPLGVPVCASSDALRAVLDGLTVGAVHEHFGVDLTDLALRATDVDWSFGSGAPIDAPAAELALLLCGRQVGGKRLSA
jgi:uncharacterized protein (TIGR03083 family)